MLIALVALVTTCGCAYRVKLKPMPVIYAPGRIDLCSIIPPQQQTRDVRVFYATNRSAAGPMDNRTYGNGIDATTHLGVSTIQIGKPGTSWSDICDASRNGDIEFRLSRSSEYSEGTDFDRAIDEQLAISPNHEVNIYVHGFHTDFPIEIEMLAKLAHCGARRGATVLFAWPARQSLFLYAGDVERGRSVAHHLADLIEQIAANTKAENINVLAYSAGAAVATDALLELRERHKNATPEQLQRDLRLGNIIYAASDIDTMTFARQQLEQLKQLATNVIIYISSNDMALRFASLNAGASRLGRPDTKRFTKAEQEAAAKDAQIQIIDVTDVPGPHGAGGMDGHGYWYANDWIMTDLLVTFRWQITPDQRGLYRKPGLARWFFPKDYPEKVTATVKRFAIPTTAPAAQ